MEAANKHKKKPQDEQKQKAKKKKKKVALPDARLLVVIDRSGSMSSIWPQTVSSFEKFVTDQQALPGKAWLTTAMFDDQYDLAHDNTPLSDVNAAAIRVFGPRGSTALYDAVGRTINNALNSHVKKGTRTMLVIITDGYENASREFNYSKIQDLIKAAQDTHKWEVIFLGANMDAKETAYGLGIKRSKAATFAATGAGAVAATATLNAMTTGYRSAVGGVAMAAYDNMDVADVYATAAANPANLVDTTKKDVVSKSTQPKS